MEASDFQVVIEGSSISPADWVRASAARGTELPELTAEQKKVARGFKISEEEYARGELARLYGQERMRARAGRLGGIVEQMLGVLGSEYRLLTVTSETGKVRWVLTIQTTEGTANIFVPRSVVDDVLDWGAREVMEDLRSRLMYGLGRNDPVSKLRG